MNDTNSGYPPPPARLLPKFVVGLWRLIVSSVGFAADSPHAAASRFLLVITLCIEWYLLKDALGDATHSMLEQAHNDAPILKTNSGPVPIAMNVAGACLLVALFAHQGLIFRNFSVPGAKESTSSVDTDSPAPRQGWTSRIHCASLRLVRFLELVIYLIFGVITGEAGYMLTVLKEAKHINAAFLLQLFGRNDGSWGKTLEDIFLVSGILLCFTVLSWDFVAWATPSMREKFKTPLILEFVVLDCFSVFIWASLCCIVVPCLSSQMFVAQSGMILLCGTGLLYVIMIFKRLLAGANKLGGAKSARDSQTIPV